MSNCGSFSSQLRLIALAVTGHLSLLLNQHIGYDGHEGIIGLYSMVSLGKLDYFVSAI